MIRILLLAAALANAAQAGAHTISVIISTGKSAYTQSLQLDSGPANFAGVVGNPPRRMVLNASLGPPRAGKSLLEYQLELSSVGTDLTSFQARSAIWLEPGARLAAVDCAGYLVTISLDEAPGAKAPASFASQNDYRLTISRDAGPAKRCRVLSDNGAQMSVIYNAMSAGRNSMFSVNSALSGTGDRFKLAYQLMDTFVSPVLQKQGEALLTPRAPVTADGATWLLEGPPPAAAPAAVPLLR